MKNALKREDAANKKLGVLIYENVQPMDVIEAVGSVCNLENYS